MEIVAVTAAGGTLRTLLEKLGSILTQEILLLYGVREEILFLRDELESMNVFLQKLSMMDDLDSQVRIWMKQVRELAYDAEDCIDQFTHHLGRVSRGGLTGCLHRCSLTFRKLIKRHQIAIRIENLKNIAHDVSLRRSRYNVDVGTQTVFAAASASMPCDPQHHARFVEETQLLGIDRSKKLLVGLLRNNGGGKLRVVSVFGFGGSGKTALAMAAYRSPQVMDSNFEYRAVVTVSRKFNIKVVLGNILKQVAGKYPDGMKKRSTIDLGEELRDHLKDKRYIIFLDDIWSVAAWESIKFALPNNINGSRIIVTTRIVSVASACSSQPNDCCFKIEPLDTKNSKNLFFQRVFRSNKCPLSLVEVSEKILKKCGGHPLAIISIAGFLAVRPLEAQTENERWNKAYDSLGSELVTNPSLERMKKVLTLSYNDLPHHLKTCFLYLSIFPEGHSIRRTVLVKKWIAEGFVISNMCGLSVEEIAETYFDEFINRSVLEPELTGTNGKVKTCHIHSLLHDLIVSKSREENFVYLLNNQFGRVLHDRVRRLSLNIRDLGRVNESLSLFQLRTLTIFGPAGSLVASLSLRCLRVLDLSNCRDLQTHHLKSIPKLFLLKYLNLRNTMIQKLPKQIEKLKYLETLDIRETGVKKLPKGIVKLQNLINLLVHNAPVMPHKIGKMRELCKLANVGLSKSLLGIDGLNRLSQLTKLGVVSRTTEIWYHIGLISVISKLSVTLRSLTIIAERGHELFQRLDDIPSPPVLLSSLHLGGKMEALPSWISSLDNLAKAKFINTALQNDAIQTLKRLPNLRSLTLLSKSYSDSELQFEDGFQSLEFLAISSCDVTSLSFNKHCMPKLQILALSCLPLQNPLSIKHLDCLREILFRSITTNFFDEILISVKTEARLHQKRPKVVVF
ncbi:hypothetical protein LUZ60_008747 [Juncus effusus]|nr:hypothetical protein LUZ60_008747 [Juncus effusus]